MWEFSQAPIGNNKKREGALSVLKTGVHRGSYVPHGRALYPFFQGLNEKDRIPFQKAFNKNDMNHLEINYNVKGLLKGFLSFF